MFLAPQNFLPKPANLLARLALLAAATETIVLSLAAPQNDNDICPPDGPSLNDIVVAFGPDGATEFIATGFRIQTAGLR